MIFRIQALLSFFLALAIVLSPAPFFGGKHTLVVLVFRLLAASAFLIHVLARRSCVPWVFSRPENASLRWAILSFLVFIAYTLLQSLFFSVNPYETREYAVQLFFYFLAYLSVLEILGSRTRLRTALFLLAVQITFLIALGYYQKLNGHEALMYGRFQFSHYAGVYSAFMNANHYGGYLVTASFLLLGSALYCREKLKSGIQLNPFVVENFYFVVLIPFIFLSSFHAGARGALLVGAGAMAVYWFWTEFPKGRGLAISAVLVFAALFGTFLVLSDASPLDSYKTLPQDLTKRIGTLKEALAMFKDHPLFGVGLGGYKWVARSYQATMAESTYRNSANNEYAELLAEAGVVGFTLFLVPLCRMLFCASKRITSNLSRWRRQLGLSALAALACLGLLCLIDHYLKTPAVAVLFILILAVVTHTAFAPEHEQKEGTVAVSDSRWPAIFALVLIAALPFCLWHAVQEYRAQSRLDGSWRYHYIFRKPAADVETIRRAPREDLLNLEKAARIRPANSEGWAVLGRAYFDETDQNRHDISGALRAIRFLRESTRRCPSWPDTWITLGKAEILSGKKKDGLADLDRGVSLASHNRDLQLYLILVYLRFSEGAGSASERKWMHDQALRWLKKAGDNERPLTAADYGFIYNYNHLKSRPVEMSQPDQKRLLRLIYEAAAPKSS